MRLSKALEEEQSMFFPDVINGIEMHLKGIVYCVCPVKKDLDRFVFMIDFMPGSSHGYPEFGVLEKFLEGFKDKELGMEATCSSIVEYLLKIKPSRLYVSISSSHVTRVMDAVVDFLYEHTNYKKNY